MDEQYEYRGHSIHVWTSEVRGAFRWSYTIDARHYTEMNDRPLQSDAIVFAEGKSQAEMHANRL